MAFIRPNFQLPPFNDVRAREALSQAFLEAPDDASRKAAFEAFQKRL